MAERILAIDPATRCGFAHSNGENGVWNLGEAADRLGVFKEAILSVHRAFGVDVIAFEQSSFGSRNPNVQAFHNELRGIIKLAASEIGARLVGYHPSTIKLYATGSGRAKKDQMMRACETILGIKPKDDNVADALWILSMATHGYVAPAEAERRMAKKVKRQGKRNPRLF